MKHHAACKPNDISIMRVCEQCGYKEDFGEILDIMKAIRSRIDGVFDDPSLVRMGPLDIDTIMDIRKWAKIAISKAEEK